MNSKRGLLSSLFSLPPFLSSIFLSLFLLSFFLPLSYFSSSLPKRKYTTNRRKRYNILTCTLLSLSLDAAPIYTYIYAYTPIYLYIHLYAYTPIRLCTFTPICSIYAMLCYAINSPPPRLRGRYSFLNKLELGKENRFELEKLFFLLLYRFLLCFLQSIFHLFGRTRCTTS